MPKYEKVDNHTIRIIVDKIDEVPLTKLVENRKQLVAKQLEIETVIRNIDEMLTEANKLGIVVEPTPETPNADTEPPKAE